MASLRHDFDGASSVSEHTKNYQPSTSITHKLGNLITIPPISIAKKPSWAHQHPNPPLAPPMPPPKQHANTHPAHHQQHQHKHRLMHAHRTLHPSLHLHQPQTASQGQQSTLKPALAASAMKVRHPNFCLPIHNRKEKARTDESMQHRNQPRRFRPRLCAFATPTRRSPTKPYSLAFVDVRRTPKLSLPESLRTARKQHISTCTTIESCSACAASSC